MNESNLRTYFVKGDVKYEVQWGHLYNNDCEIYKRKNQCKENCKHRNDCKLYVINAEEGVVKIKRTNVSAKLPVRGTAGAAGYDLAGAQGARVPAHSKCLVKIGLAIAIPPEVQHRIEIELGSDPPYRLGPAEQDELEEQIKDLLA